MDDDEDFAAGLREHPRFVPIERFEGTNLDFRAATVDDAEFILSLRLDPSKNAYLSETSPDLEAQRKWLASMGTDQLYFIIEHQGRPVGTVRLYDQRASSFCWGSWILSGDAPKGAARESMMMVYQLAFDLGFAASHFDVRKGNEKVWRFHERMGAVRTGETEHDFLYSIDKATILNRGKA